MYVIIILLKLSRLYNRAINSDKWKFTTHFETSPQAKSMAIRAERRRPFHVEIPARYSTDCTAKIPRISVHRKHFDSWEASCDVFVILALFPASLQRWLWRQPWQSDHFPPSTESSTFIFLTFRQGQSTGPAQRMMINLRFKNKQTSSLMMNSSSPGCHLQRMHGDGEIRDFFWN